MQVKRILELFWWYWDQQHDYPGETLIAIEEFWFDWDMQEKSQKEIHNELVDAGCDPDALNRRIKLMILEFKANHEMEEAFKRL
jgi:hypothetical protein